MQLQQLRYFISAAHFLSFSNAARYHMIPQSAISKTIAALESELGIKLFIRENRTVRLTQAGQFFLDSVSAAINTLDNAVERLSAGENTYHIRVSVCAGIYVFRKIIQSFSKLHPEYRFTILEQYPNVIDPNSYDVAFGNETTISPHLHTAKLFSERMMMAVSDKYLPELPTHVHAGELAQHPFVGFLPSFRYQKMIDAFCTLHNVDLHPAIQVDSGLTMVKLIEDGAGIGVLPEITWTDDLENKKIRLVPIEEKEFRQSMFILWKKGEMITEGLQTFIDYAQSYCAEEFGDTP